ncbi:MAG TPA: ROK family protein [Pseudonocardiaceae bacterium]
MSSHGFGIDVGGSGIKGCTVDLDTGTLVGDRLRITTPDPSTPEAVATVAARIVGRFGWRGRLGVTVPCVVKHGTVLTAANVDPSWIGTDAPEVLGKEIGEPVVVLNDADAAGIAEMRYGAGRDVRGVVVLLTFGTGIGSAVFSDGELVPNTEFGHLQLDGRDAEDIAAASVKEQQDLSWEEWTPRVSRYLAALESLVWPDLIIVGGGISKDADRWLPMLENRTRVVAAQLRNAAGIVGAALAAHTGFS